jgi:hypothetical protein
MNQGRKESQTIYSAKVCFVCYVGFCAAATVWVIVELIKLIVYTTITMMSLRGLILDCLALSVDCLNYHLPMP